MSDVGDLVGSHLIWVVQLLMIAKRTLGGLVCPEKIEEMDKELTKVIEDFNCTVNVEALHLALTPLYTKLTKLLKNPLCERWVLVTEKQGGCWENMGGGCPETWGCECDICP